MIVYAEENNLNELTKEGFCIVDFYSDTCGPCKLLATVFSKLETELPFVKVIKVNTSTYPNYTTEYEVNAVPTVLFLNDGELKERHTGFLSEDQLKEKIGEYMYE
jgi:thioredoxin